MTLVDGTLLSALPLLVQAMLLKECTGSGLVKWRLHTQEVVEERPLTDADLAAGILSDQIVRFANGKAEARPDHPIRLVCVKCSLHTSRCKYRGGSSGVDSDGVLRITTNLLEVPAEIIGLIYLLGLATEAELFAHAEKLKQRDAVKNCAHALDSATLHGIAR